MPSPDRWLSVAEASPVIGKSPSYVRGLIRDKKLHGIRHTEGGKFQIRESECARYLATLEADAPQTTTASV